MSRFYHLMIAMLCGCLLVNAQTSADDAPAATAAQSGTEKPARRWQIGDNPDLRPRLAVCTFQLRNGHSTVVGGVEVGGKYLVDKLAEALNDALSQSRKFTMLDRAYNAQIQTELNRLSFDSADPNDLVKLGKLLATDYLLVGTAEVMEPVQPQVNPYTGVARQPSVTFMEVHYRLLVAATGQVHVSDTIDLQTDEISGRTADEYISATLVRAATRISDEILESVMPMEVVGLAGQEVIIGQGGKGVSVGEVLELFAPGEELFDSRTGESLGRTDTAVGRIQVVRVMPKISYCRILNCTMPPAKGMTVRRLAQGYGMPDNGMQYQEAPATGLGTTPGGGYLPPFGNR